MSKYLKITNIYDYIYTPYMLSRPLSDTPYQIIDAYFNRPDVKTAMHVDQQMTFSLLSQKVSQNYVSFGSSLDFYQQFFYANLKILIYNGLNDADVPFKYTRDSILLLQQKTGMKLTQKQAQWVTPMPSKQIPGFVQYYTFNFALALVRNAGHEVPQYQREFAYFMFDRFINTQIL